MGDAAGELILAEWFKVVGDPVRKGEPLFAVETDKTTVTVEALASGVLSGILVQAGEPATEGQPIAHISVRESGSG
jgi:pyruvate/2-oxoglutarate dehydrogenase complex dihydrolipoamide acyltransferase (E2) component